jgi:oligopeptide transport permease C-like protein
VVSEGYVDVPRAQGQWALAWRRLRRDQVAVACGIFLLLDLFAVGPGLGRTLLRALAGFQGYDLPVILAVTLVAGTAIILLNLAADLIVLALDPTVAQRGRGTPRVAGRAA